MLKGIRKNLKKAATVFCLCFIALIGLAGCGDRGLLKEAKSGLPQFSETGLSEPKINEANYGALAYGYLEYIQENYPGRIPGSEREREMAVFLLRVLLDGGFEGKNLRVQTFQTEENTVPVQAGGSASPDGVGAKGPASSFDGGESEVSASSFDGGESEVSAPSFDGGEATGSSQNIEVTIQGDSEKFILVGAHYDSAGTHGVDDNGSGVAVLLESALRMRSVRPPDTIRYVFFGAEETGMNGSRAYVEALSQEEKENLLFMVNVDSVLAGDILYLYGGTVGEDGDVADTWAVEAAYEIAQKLGLEIQLPPEDNPDYPFPTGQRRSDHAPFADIGIPYVYFEANQWKQGNPVETEEYGIIMHTEMDDLDFIDQAFPGRAQSTLSAYSELLQEILENGLAQ